VWFVVVHRVEVVADDADGCYGAIETGSGFASDGYDTIFVIPASQPNKRTDPINPSIRQAVRQPGAVTAVTATESSSETITTVPTPLAFFQLGIVVV